MIQQKYHFLKRFQYTNNQQHDQGGAAKIVLYFVINKKKVRKIRINNYNCQQYKIIWTILVFSLI